MAENYSNLANIWMDATSTLSIVTYVFDEMITVFTDGLDGKVEITFAHHLSTAYYDLVVGADGMLSRTRRLLFDQFVDDDKFIHRLGQCAVLFIMPRTEDDTRFARGIMLHVVVFYFCVRTVTEVHERMLQ